MHGARRSTRVWRGRLRERASTQPKWIGAPSQKSCRRHGQTLDKAYPADLPKVRRRYQRRFHRVAGQGQEVGEEQSTAVRADRFGMELDTVDRQRPMPHGHDFLPPGTVCRPGRDLQHRRHAQGRNDQRVIAHDRQRCRQALEHTNLPVLDVARLAVHQSIGPHDLAPERLADRLVAEADAKQGDPGISRTQDEGNGNAGLRRGAGTRRDDDGLGSKCQRLAH